MKSKLIDLNLSPREDFYKTRIDMMFESMMRNRLYMGILDETKELKFRSIRILIALNPGSKDAIIAIYEQYKDSARKTRRPDHVDELESRILDEIYEVIKDDGQSQYLEDHPESELIDTQNEVRKILDNDFHSLSIGNSKQSVGF